MPYKAALRSTHQTAALLPASSCLKYIIVHYIVESGVNTPTALTLDYGNKENFEKASLMITSVFMSGSFVNFDESKGKKEHDVFHRDMTQVLRTDMLGTITDYHQHWVTSLKPRLNSDNLGFALQKLFKPYGYISKANSQWLSV